MTPQRTSAGVVAPHASTTIHFNPPPGPNEKVAIGVVDMATRAFRVIEGEVVENQGDGHLAYVAVVLPGSVVAATQAPWRELLEGAKAQIAQPGGIASAVRAFCGAALDGIARWKGER